MVAALLAGFPCAFGYALGQDAGSRMVICIDPGHSKQTVGAHGRRLAEYRVCWQVARRLQSDLTRQGVTAILTKRSMDENVANERRAGVANAAHADLFLRLHCDAGSESGIATFYPDVQGTKNGVTGPSRAVMAQSRRCAHALHAALLQSLNGDLHDRGLRTDRQTAVGSQQGGALTGSIYARVPVVLVEMCVLSNPRDEAYIGSDGGQEHMARALGVAAIAAVQANRGAR